MHMSDERSLDPKFGGQFTCMKQLRAGEETGQQKHGRQISWQPAPHRQKLLLNRIYCCKEYGSATPQVEGEKRYAVQGHGGKVGVVNIDRDVFGMCDLYWENRTCFFP